MKVILLVAVALLAACNDMNPFAPQNTRPSCWDGTVQDTWAEPQTTFTVDNTSCTLYYIKMGRHTTECAGEAGTWGRFVRCKDGTGAHVEAPNGKLGWQ